MGWQRYSEAWPLPATYTLTAAVLHTIACSRFVEVSSKPLFIQFSSRMINSAMSNRNTSPSRDSFIACRFQFSRLKLNFFLNSLTFALYYSWLNSSIFVYWSTRTCENDPKYRTLNTRLFTKKKRNPTRSRRRGKIQTSISKRRTRAISLTITSSWFRKEKRRFGWANCVYRGNDENELRPGRGSKELLYSGKSIDWNANQLRVQPNL